MHDEMKTEAMELCVTACEKFSSNNEVFILRYLLNKALLEKRSVLIFNLGCR
jgi:hypothetical protein